MASKLFFAWDKRKNDDDFCLTTFIVSLLCSQLYSFNICNINIHSAFSPWMTSLNEINSLYHISHWMNPSRRFYNYNAVNEIEPLNNIRSFYTWSNFYFLVTRFFSNKYSNNRNSNQKSTQTFHRDIKREIVGVMSYDYQVFCHST